MFIKQQQKLYKKTLRKSSPKNYFSAIERREIQTAEQIDQTYL